MTIWDVESGNKDNEWSCGSPVRSIDMNNDCSVVVTGTANGKACAWETFTGMEVMTFQCHGIVYSVDLSGDGRYLMTGDQSRHAIMWDVATGCIVQKCLCSDIVKRVDLSGDNRLLAVGCGFQCELWDVESGCLIERRNSGGRVKLSSDSKYLAAADASGTITTRRISDASVPSFWTEMAAADPVALADLAEV